LGPVIDNQAEHQYVSGHHPSSFLRKRKKEFKSRADKEKKKGMQSCNKDPVLI
jgi:hypothetical protein